MSWGVVYNLRPGAVLAEDGVTSDMNRFWIFAAAISCAFASNPALPAGNAQNGAAKAAVCQACHGANGNSANPQWPSLAGLGADYIAEQLQNFKDGKRANPIMQPMAAPLSAQDMQDLGAYFDTLVNTGLEADPAYWQAGEKLYRGGDKARGIPACMACHGPIGRRQRTGKVSRAARPALGVRHQAADRLCSGHAAAGAGRHHGHRRQASVGRRHPQTFPLICRGFADMRAIRAVFLLSVALALAACSKHQAGGSPTGATAPAQAARRGQGGDRCCGTRHPGGSRGDADFEAQPRRIGNRRGSDR